MGMNQHQEECVMTDRPADRRDGQNEEPPQSGHGRSGSGVPASEDPAGDIEYRGPQDQDEGPIFVETPDGEHEYGR